MSWLYGERMADHAKPIAQALLDLYSGFIPGGGEEGNKQLVTSTVARLNELGAFRAEPIGEDEIGVNADRMITAIVYLEHYLIDRLAKAEQVDTDAVVFDAREFLDSLPED